MSEHPEGFPPDDGDEGSADPKRKRPDDRDERSGGAGASAEGSGDDRPTPADRGRSGDSGSGGERGSDGPSGGGVGGENGRNGENGENGENEDNPLAAMLRALGGEGGLGNFGGLGNLAGLGNLGNLGGLGGPGGGMPGFDPQMLGMMFTRIGQMLSFEGGPVNWDLAREMARTAVASRQDPSPSEGDKRALADAVRLAELWLDDVTTLPAGTTETLAWSRAEWIEQTLPVWKKLVEPVAERMTNAMGGVLPAGDADMGPLTAMIKQIGGAIFGGQLGQALASLATEVVSSTDVGLPLGPSGKAALLPANVKEFGGGLEMPNDEVRLYLALREAAYHRLFAHVPWLRARLLGAVEAYARGIRIDESRLTDLAGNAQSLDPEALQELLAGGGMFGTQDTPEQQAALARLETLLALVEGWVDATVHESATGHLPHAEALRETLRRRRATGGPAEQTFSALVGLQLRPRRLRDAARLWASLTDARGTEGRDAVWAHPDLLPTPKDLDDPDGFVHRDEIDIAGLEDLMRGDTGGDDEPPSDGGNSGDRPGDR